MITIDTSVVIAGLVSAHAEHGPAREVLGRERPRLVGHVAFEAYSVLTRLPVPDRLVSRDAWRLLAGAFPEEPLVLEGGPLRQLLQRLAEAGVAGGAVYDGLVAGTAASYDAELVTLDRRAVPTYELVGTRHRILGNT